MAAETYDELASTIQTKRARRQAIQWILESAVTRAGSEALTMAPRTCRVRLRNFWKEVGRRVSTVDTSPLKRFRILQSDRMSGA